jgi:lipopolysaccharide export system permease protein
VTIIDRYILRTLIINYIIVLAVMLSLYVTLDMFVNMDEFTESDPPLPQLLANIATYYGPNLTLYFAQLSGVITTFACLAAVARLRTQNELIAMLSSGMSLYRLAVPILGFGLVVSGLLIVDTEVLIPKVAHRLGLRHEDMGQPRSYEVLFLPDANNALLCASRFTPETQELHQVLVLHRDGEGNLTYVIEADRAIWQGPLEGVSRTSEDRPMGRWRLVRGVRKERVIREEEGIGPQTRTLTTFVDHYDSQLTPDELELRQAEGWIRFLSVRQLSELEAQRVGNLAAIVQTKHARFTTPATSFILLLLGLPFFLDRSPANVLGDATRALLVCGLCYLTSFAMQNLRPDSASALPSWIPIFIFATIAVVLFDRIRT